MTIIADYSSWESPITAELVSEGTSAIATFLTDEKGNSYWTESRPTNKGRHTLVKRDTNGAISDVTDPEMNVRTFVHEYGGGPFTIHDDTIYTSIANDSAIWELIPGHAPRRITEKNTCENKDGHLIWTGTRFADIRWTPYGLIAVAEKHTPGQEAQNFLALINIETGETTPIAQGCDFYASPALSKDYKKIAWICWKHPNMPWDDTELWVADITPQGTLINAKKLSGNTPESILQPEWAPDGSLYFISDRDKGWWNIHRYKDGVISNVTPLQGEVGEPLWIFGRSTYTLLGDNIFFAQNHEGKWTLKVLNTKTGAITPVSRPGVYFQYIRTANDAIQLLEGYSDQSEAIVQIENKPGFPSKTLYQKPPIIANDFISIPQHITFQSHGRTAYGYYYPPKNPKYSAPNGSLPPLVVMIHGGPTSQARVSLQNRNQFWTSKGFAILDVNYGGSTGYGRDYRNLLNNNWGIVDVEDCVAGARHLIDKGLVDKRKVFIRGGSSGGFTVLCAIATGDTFTAGADYFGVADLKALAQDTHKFESRYLHNLLGKYPEEKKIWDERSPINNVDKIKKPLIIFQGENDPIVPKNQSVMIYDALKKAGLQTELHIYPDEEHGFKYPQNNIDSLKREFSFYRKEG